MLYERSDEKGKANYLGKFVTLVTLIQMEAFRFIHEVMSNDDYVQFEREEVERAALDSLQASAKRRPTS